MTSELRYYASPVDYEAWRKGYMPPSEHILIHKLSVGEVKVVASSSIGGDGWWLVVGGGKPLSKAQKKAIRFLMETMDDDDPPPAEPPQDLPGAALSAVPPGEI